MDSNMEYCELPDFLKGPDGRLGTFMPQFDTSDGTIHFLVPSGIGDVAWPVSKFIQKMKDGAKIKWWFPDDHAKRVEPYAKLMGLDYGFMTIDIRQLLSYPGQITEEDFNEGGVWYLHANRHLEEGKKLVDWCPWLPFTNPAPPVKGQPGGGIVHLNPTGAHVAEFQQRVLEPYIVLHAGSSAYCEGNWFPRTWARIVEHIEQTLQIPVLMVGLDWDEQMIDAVYKVYKPSRVPMISRPLHMVLTEIVNSAGMIGVDSGLTILATYYGKPAFRLYPRWLHKMPGTWEDPEKLHYLNEWHFMDEMMDYIYPWLRLLAQDLGRG